MKITKLISFIVLCASLINLAQAQQKIGYVDTEVIIGLLPVTKKANDEIAGMQTKFLRQGQTMQNEVKAKYDDLIAQNEAGTLSENMKQLGQQEMTQLQEDLIYHSQQSQETLTKRRSVLFKPILKQVNETIHEVSKEKGYSMVLDAQGGGILYASGDDNLTEEVLLALGVDTSKLKPASE